MANRVELQVHLAFDEDAAVWYVAKTEIPGLSLEADTPLELLQRIVDSAPELIELNSGECAEVVGIRPADGSQAHRRLGKRGSPLPVAVRPIFDAPLNLAHA